MIATRSAANRSSTLCRIKGSLLASTAFVVLSTAAVLPVVLIAGATSAFADGGSGGNDSGGGTGGAGGSGFSGSPGGDGAGAGGGGGGGAGGGNGGGASGAPGAGGTGGTGNGGSGGNGQAFGQGSGGGGGGAHGNGSTGVLLPGTLLGGDGGNGADKAGNGNGGGGGGAGGYGAVLTGGSAVVITSPTTVTGGNGGNGGAGDTAIAAQGGSGGDGGVGVQFTPSGGMLTNSGSISGGNGGTGGTGGSGNGANGAGGAGIVGSGLTIINSGSITGGTAGGGGAQADAITFTGGTNFLTLSSGATAGTLTGGIGISGSLTIDPGAANGGSATLASIIHDAANGPGSITVNTARTLTLTGANTYSGGTTISGSGTIVANNAGATNISLGSGAVTLNNGTLATDQNTDLFNNVMVAAGGGTIRSSTSFGVDGNITGAGQLTFQNTGAANNNITVLLGDNSAFNGTTIVASGVLAPETLHGLSSNSAYQVASGATLSAGFSVAIGSLSDFAGSGGVVTTGNSVVLTTGGNNSSTTFSGVIQDGTGTMGLIKTGTGIFTLAGANNYTGATTVNAGALNVTGSIASSVLTTVDANATLMGAGAVGATQINANGTFAPGSGTPGSAMTVNGSLALASGALYAVALNPTTASSATVTGAASLGGATVNATFANGSYITKQYTILTAGSLGGTTFNAAVANTNLPSNFSDTLSYDPTHAFLNLALNFTGPSFSSGLSGNQQAVANTLVNFFNTTGGIPMAFGALGPAGLTQVSGETATGSQQTTFNAMGQFMGVMTDPFMNRGGGVAGSSPSSGYAEEDSQASAYAASKKTDAFAMFTKAPPSYKAPQTFEQRWSVWAAGYGGSQSTDGSAVTGSNNTTSSIAGTAVGADYLFSPDTIAGFAIAGGGTNFSVANGGSGRSDLFQAGAYVRHNEGPAYISAALAYGWQDITTNRTVTAVGFDQLRAEFNANAYSGRLEGGYRFVAPWVGGIGITPYAAAQFTTFDLPFYAESVLAGAGTSALAYGAKDVTDARSELGFRTDKSFLVQDGILTLRSRFAWAHDYDPNRSIAATFQSLPASSFVVNGAAQASDSALTTASIEMKWRNGWSAAATFEGEFSDVTTSYAGKGMVRYTW